MKLLLAIIVILAISVLGSRLTFLNRRLRLGFSNIILTGTEYLFIGLLLGGSGFKLIDAATLAQFQPFLVFGLAWIGFLFGLQFEIRKVKALPRFYFAIAAVQAFVTFGLVAGAMYLVFNHFALLPPGTALIASLVLGSAASCTAQSALGIIGQNYRFRNRKLLDLMRYISSVDGIYALVFFAAALALFPGGKITGVGDIEFLKSFKWLAISVTMGAIPGLIFISLSRIRFSPQEFALFLMGTVTFCGGLAQQINYSPLIAGFVCGVLTANLSRHRLRALSITLHAEKSIYIFLLLLLGAGWTLEVGGALIVTAVYVVVRLVGKYSGNLIATRVFKPDCKVPHSIGLGLISEGGLAVAVIINVLLLYPAFADTLITIVVLSVFINEFFSPWLILSQFDRDDRTPVRRS